MNRETKITLAVVFISIIFMAAWVFYLDSVYNRPKEPEPVGLTRMGPERCDFDLDLGYGGPAYPDDLFVVKPRGDYADYVLVGLTPGKSEIAYYPAPRSKEDLEDHFPIILSDGYLTYYRRWVGDAYLDLTWREYYSKIEVISPSEMMDHILDDDPFLEAYNCGIGNYLIYDTNLENKTREFFDLWRTNGSEKEFEDLIVSWQEEGIDEDFIGFVTTLWSFDRSDDEKISGFMESWEEERLRNTLNLIIDCGRISECKKF